MVHVGVIILLQALAEVHPVRLQEAQVGSADSDALQLTDLDADTFSPAQGRNGYWSPDEFFAEVGANIYELEKFDPAKTPILFVHGAAGTPQDWRYFVAHVDRDRYQAWFYYYPSGAPVAEAANVLYQRLQEIQARYRPLRLYITAHSLGGLVVRDLLARYGDSLPWIKLFVSISTPWGGEHLTEWGTRLSPVVVPAWRDLRPNGRFLRGLFARALPESLDYYLFFGHRGSRSLLRPNNDGAVTLSSMLRQEAQDEADGIYGFDESHVGILSSQEAVGKYSALLDMIEEAANPGTPRKSRVPL